MNEKKPKWNCPVCNKAAHFENLFLDGFYIQLLQSPQFRALSTNDIVLNQVSSGHSTNDIVLNQVSSGHSPPTILFSIRLVQGTFNQRYCSESG